MSKIQTGTIIHGTNVAEAREIILNVVRDHRISSIQRKCTVLVYLMSDISCSDMEFVTPSKGQIQV